MVKMMIAERRKKVKIIPFEGETMLTLCDSCTRYGKVRKYRSLWLCVGPPERCWSRRRMIYAALRERSAAR